MKSKSNLSQVTGRHHPTVQAACEVITHALGLFTDDGTLLPDGIMQVGEHFRETGSLIVGLFVTRGTYTLQILRLGDLPADAETPPLMSVSWEIGSDAQVAVFRRGEWEAEIIAATGSSH